MAKIPDLKFSEYPFKVPNYKAVMAKMEAMINELKACKDANSASCIIKKWNKLSSNVDTQSNIIYVN